MCESSGPPESTRFTPGMRCSLALLICLVVYPVSATAQDDPAAVLDSIDWRVAPENGALGDVAEIAIPEGCMFTGGADTRKLLELMENPTGGLELGLIAPQDFSWFVVFEYDAIGYVKDDDQDSLDADAMLKSIQAGTEAGNKERRKRGWPTMEILGWEQPPHYDSKTNNLVWAVRGASEGEVNVNYNTRRLGRKGVMSVALVVDPPQLAGVLPTFDSLMEGFAFVPGQTYAEFRSGDKIAEYGLTALVTGGAVAVAAKTGLLKWLWKGIVVAVVAVGAAIKGLFGRRSASAS